MAALKERAETDPQAAEELAAQRAYHVEAATRSRQKLVRLAETDPAAAAKLEAKREYKRQYESARKQALIEAAKTDPVAAEKLADVRHRAVETTQPCNAKHEAAAM